MMRNSSEKLVIRFGIKIFSFFGSRAAQSFGNLLFDFVMLPHLRRSSIFHFVFCDTRRPVFRVFASDTTAKSFSAAETAPKIFRFPLPNSRCASFLCRA